ncbi:MAG TPA: NAD(P)/FAD-dependent oxidoreductase [Terriglobales bacterium]
MAAFLDTDVFVVGGGPAGLAVAIAARQHGLRAAVADCASPPIDKTCGEGLMPDSLDVVQRLGVNLQATDRSFFRGIKFVGPKSAVAASFPHGCGLGIRRTDLHQIFAEHAQAQEVELLWRARVSFPDSSTIAVNGARVRSRWLIGADGQNSRVREWAGLSPGQTRAVRFSMRRHYRVRRWSEYVEIYWGNEGQAYVTPVGLDMICVAIISRQRWPSFGSALAGFPQLRERLAGAAPASDIRGALSISRRLRRVCRNNVALVGEASGSVDAITGEGLALGFRQALALAPALVAGDLAAYATAHRSISHLPEFMSRTMLLLDASPSIRRRTLLALSKQPELFERLLAVHVGELQLKHFGARGLLDLGWRLLAA